jgi:hypothetical protein
MLSREGKADAQWLAGLLRILLLGAPSWRSFLALGGR